MNTEQPFWVSAISALLLCLVGAGLCFAQQERGRVLPRVWVVATGGTIAGTGASSTDLSNYRSGTVLGEDVMQSTGRSRGGPNCPSELGRDYDFGIAAPIGRAQLDSTQRGGLTALRIADGTQAWFAANTPCYPPRPGCSPAQPAAVTAMQGAVFSGLASGNGPEELQHAKLRKDHRMRLFFSVLLTTFSTPVEKRGLMVEIKDVVRLP